MTEEERKNLQRKQKLQQYRDHFGLHYSLWDKYCLSSFEVLPGNELAYKTALEFICATEDIRTPYEKYSTEDEVEAWYDRHPCLHHFLTFVGGCGRGKTHLALGCGIWEIEKMELSTIYYQVPNLLATLRDSYDDGNTGPSHRQFMDSCKFCELLILDDLGMQRNTDWAVEQLDSLIDYRYMNDLQTIFTTNLKPNQLPPRIASRMKEGEVVSLTCGDYREVIARRRTEKREVDVELHRIIKQNRG
jgi:DNA replication protein DnaC